MENIKRLIQENNLISEGDVIGVGVSGGKDSMALLHYLKSISKELDFEVVAITVDHAIRDESASDAMFVADWCRKNRIRCYKFRMDVPKISAEKKVSLEVGAREARYGVFNSMIEKGIVDKIALAHHTSDQAETVLLHLFRGTGITGLQGMQKIRDGIFIRPMLETQQKEILAYILEHDIQIVEDKTNAESDFSRNYIRNKIMPLILEKWPNAINSIRNFSNLASKDDKFIYSQVPTDAFLVKEKQVSVPLSYFIYDEPIVSRMLFKAFSCIGVNKDIESKHIDLVCALKNAENGKKIDLPMKVTAIKEYDYITLVNKNVEVVELDLPFKSGTFVLPNGDKMVVKKVKEIGSDNALYFDGKKLPKNVTWRYRQDGDVFEKFGGGTKKLKSYLIDKKYPQRLRATLPVLADDKEVYVIGGVEISQKVRISEGSTSIYRVEILEKK